MRSVALCVFVSVSIRRRAFASIRAANHSEGDAALNKLFKEIYDRADEDTRYTRSSASRTVNSHGCEVINFVGYPSTFEFGIPSVRTII